MASVRLPAETGGRDPEGRGAAGAAPRGGRGRWAGSPATSTWVLRSRAPGAAHVASLRSREWDGRPHCGPGWPWRSAGGSSGQRVCWGLCQVFVGATLTFPHHGPGGCPIGPRPSPVLLSRAGVSLRAGEAQDSRPRPPALASAWLSACIQGSGERPAGAWAGASRVEGLVPWIQS